MLPTGLGTGAGFGFGFGLGFGLAFGVGLVPVGDGDRRVALGEGDRLVPVGDGDGLVPVGDGDGLVRVGDGDGLVRVGDGDGLVRVGDGDGLVRVGDGDGLVPVGDGDGLVPVGDGDGLVPVGDGDGLVPVGDGDGLVPVGDGDGLMAQLGTVITSSSRVTAPFRASTRPVMVSPVCTVIEVRAKMVPWKVELVFRVAELPTCQNTLQACAPPVSRILLPVLVPRVEPAWKMNTAPGTPCASRVSDPPTSSDDVALYTPGARVWPAPMNPPMDADLTRPAASLYAVVRSAWAPAAASAV